MIYHYYHYYYVYIYIYNIHIYFILYIYIYIYNNECLPCICEWDTGLFVNICRPHLLVNDYTIILRYIIRIVY